MRRLLIIFLLVLLPIQAAWASACAYCPDSCLTEPAPAGDSGAVNDDDDCNRCQLGGVAIPPAPGAARIASSAHKLRLFDTDSFLESGQPDRPERPKWKRAA